MESKAQSEMISPQSFDALDAAERSKRLALLTAAGLSAVYLVSIFYAPAGEPNGNYFTICGFKNFTGLPCPGCGLVHSFCATGKGDFASAFAFNLLGPPLFLFSLFYWVKSLCVLLKWDAAARVFERAAGRIKPIRALFAAFVVYGVARILYLIFFQPSAVQDSPLLKLIAQLNR